MLTEDSLPDDMPPDPELLAESPIDAFELDASEAIKNMCAIVTKMLSQLNVLDETEVASIGERLSSPFKRMYQATRHHRTSSVWPLVLASTYVVAPVILLRLSASKHTWLGYGAVYVSALLLGYVAGIIYVLFIGLTSGTGNFYVSRSISESTGVKERSLQISRLYLPKREILWAWSEIHERDRLRREASARKRAIYRLTACIAGLLLIAAGALIGTQLTDSTAIEILCISALTPILAATIAFLAEVSARISRPRPARLSDSLEPGDATIVDLINLAFLINHKRLDWNNSHTVTRLLTEVEKAARTAEYAFPGRSARVLARDVQTTAWAREQSARIASGIRRQKRTILLARGPTSLDEVTKWLCLGLAGAAHGNWDDLTMFSGLRSAPTRLRRLARLVAPPSLLGAAAIFIPELTRNAGTRDTIRLSLIVAAVLGLITAFSPESEEAAATIRGSVDKITTFR